MQQLLFVNEIITAALVLVSGYLVVFALVSLFHRPQKLPPRAPDKRYAVLICARNEAAVIARLLDSIRNQTYPQALLTSFVLADNCTDDTAGIARAHGATVYTRADKTKVGKGYALDALLSHIRQDAPDAYDGYFIIDADNVLAPDYVERMHEAFCAGHEIVSGYHNTRNMDGSVFTLGQAVMFLTQNRFFNYPRTLLGLSAFISGTGILIGASVLKEAGGWPYHMLTEDVEFSMVQLQKGRRAFFCRGAVFYDEKPVRFRDSRNQLIRWIQGFLQVMSVHGAPLIRRAIRQRDFSCYDMLMGYTPAAAGAAVSMAFSIAFGIAQGIETRSLIQAVLPVLFDLASICVMMLLIGIATVLLEWKRIRASCGRKLLAAASYPVYMLLFVGVSLIAPFCARQWKAIAHGGEGRRKNTGKP